MAEVGWLSPEETASLDAAYQPIEPFDAWAELAPSGTVWQGFVERWEEARREASADDVAALLQDVTRGAAFDTGAIEGLYAGDRGITRTIMAQAATWEAYVAQERGPQVVEFVKAHVEGFQMALDVATGGQVVTEAWIRQVHEVVCAPQDHYEVTTPVGRQRHRLAKGAYKTQPNHVRQPDGTPFPYAPADRTPAEMARLVEQLRSDAFAAAHPATQAAYAHYAFVRIHPFADGNGRVARVLASVSLLRALSVPLVIYADQRDQYIDALEQADDGDRSAFVRFVADRTVDTVRVATRRVRRGQAGAHLRLRKLLDQSMTDADVEAAFQRLVELVIEEWSRQVETLVGEPVRSGVARSTAAVDPPDGFRAPPDEWMPTLHLSLSASALGRSFAVGRWVSVFVARDRAHPFPLRIVGPVGTVDLRVADVDPQPTTALRLELSEWLADLVELEAAELARQLEDRS